MKEGRKVDVERSIAVYNWIVILHDYFCFGVIDVISSGKLKNLYTTDSLSLIGTQNMKYQLVWVW